MNHHVQKITKKTFRRYLLFLITSLLIVLLVGGWFLYGHFTQKNDLNDVTVIKSAVAKHYLLPSNEGPALATVEDKTKVNTEFLAVAENGDKLLIYKNNKLVLLYRPSIDRIIRVGPISIADTDTIPK